MLPGAVGYYHIFKPCLFKFRNATARGVRDKLRPIGGYYLQIPGHRLSADTEIGDDAADDSAEYGAFFKYCRLDAAAPEEVGRRHPRRAAADNRGPRAAQRGGARKRLHGLGETLFRAEQLDGAYLHGLVIEAACAAAHAAVAANRARDKGQRVFVEDHGKRLAVAFLSRKPDIFRHILFYRTTLFAGRNEAVGQGNGPFYLPVRGGFRRLPVLFIKRRPRGELFNLFVVHPAEGFAAARGIFVGKLLHPLVAARLQERSRDRHWPDTGAVEFRDVLRVGAAGPRYTQRSAEILGKTARHLERQREERAPGHIHLATSHYVVGIIHREGVRQLHAESKAVRGRLFRETPYHRHRVRVLQIVKEMMVVELHVGKAEFVHLRAGIFIS